ncbi:DUF3467 domain-containing protein [Planctomicrobium sp. SH664]|uniref:DUF3467 domain-containing protein n=1 Tax=Planctomicrobium sp. SH664 TaxID=3448125 RepID=UPI003F5B8B45
MSPPPDDSPADDSPDWGDAAGNEESLPVQGQVRHNNLSARVPEEVGQGVFSNGVMILTGAFEVVLDFALRLGEQQRICARVILPHVVAHQFVSALQENIRNFEMRFGPLPQMPKPLPERRSETPTPLPAEESPASSAPALPGGAAHPENQPQQTSPAFHIEDIYHELKLADSMLSGRYANAVLIRHSPTEFCFDFITNVYPRSAVSARVFLATPHIVPFLRSLSHSLTPPPTTPGPPV